MKRLSAPIESLQAASEVLFINSHLRKTANSQLIYACIMLGQSVLSYPERGAIISMLGAIILGTEAMWLLRSKKPAPILGAAVLLWAAALWNVYFYFQSPAADLSATWVVVALLYCYFGFREYATYRKFCAALLAQTPEASRELDDILSSIGRAGAGLLEPHVNGDRWQMLLYDNGIVMRNTIKGGMLIGDRESTRVEPYGKTLGSALQKIKMEVRGRKLSCTFREAEAGALLSWSAGAQPCLQGSAAARV